MRLVSNWKSFWRWHSTWAMAALAALPYAWTQIPPELKASLPDAYLPWIAAALGVAGVIGRVRDQGGGE